MKGIMVNIDTKIGENLISNWRKSSYYVADSDSVICRTKKWQDIFEVPITCKKGDKVSVSWECRGSGFAENFFLGFYKGDNAASPFFNLKNVYNNGLAKYELTGKWQRLWITYTALRDYNGNGWDDSVLFRIEINDNSTGFIEARNFKVELGAYPTDIE